MNTTEEIFLEAYRFALRKKSFTQQNTEEAAALRYDLSASEWRRLFALAESHRVFPMIYEAVCPEPDHVLSETSVFRNGLRKAEAQTLSQARTTAEFLRLYHFLERKGLSPIVVKGIVCRSLYPNPEQRSSSDEDLLIPEKDLDAYHKAFTEFGLQADVPESEFDEHSEISYYNDRVYIELHKSLFPPESRAYGDLNRFFADAEERKTSTEIYGVRIFTMEPTDHLFYQLCHAYKHFLNCGVGIRLLSDIALFSIAYGEQIDWPLVTDRCCEIHAMDFASAIYRIVRKHLLRDAFPEYLQEIWLEEEKDEMPLLLDILKGGIYGTSSEDRLHSANITLGRIEAEKAESSKPTIIRTLFPGFSFMARRCPYLKKVPFLLPAAWIQRMGSYAYKAVLHKRGGQSATEAVQIGKERVRLMENYRMVGTEKESLLKRIYKRSQRSFLAPVLSPVYKGIAASEYFFLNLHWFLRGNRRPDRQEKSLVRDNVTFIVKSFERKALVKGLCRNISRMYPGVSIVIADDSRKPLKIRKQNVRVITLPFNCGLGAGLYAALQEVRTPYLFRMDDDELLTRKSLIHRELKYLMKHPELDLIGLGHTTAIRLHSLEFNFREYYSSSMDDAPLPLKIPHMTKLDDNHIVLGKVANIYLARTEKIREVGFDPEIKVIDHHEFFWRAAGRLASAAALDTVVFHRHNPYDRQYNRYRSDYQEDLDYIRKKRLRTLREAGYEK